MKRYTVWTLIGATLSLITLIAVVLVNHFRPAEYTDPFTRYDAIAPGQPTIVLAWGVCDYKFDYDDVGGGFICSIEPDDGPFQSISVMAEEKEIYSVSFHVSNLQVGDLVYRWGRPDTVRHSHRGYSLYWRGGVYATVSTSGWYTLESPVDYVLLKQTTMPKVYHV